MRNPLQLPFRAALLFSLAATQVGCNCAASQLAVPSLELRSSSFAAGTIPNRYSSCKGEDDISPELLWRAPPERTQSFALIVFEMAGGPPDQVLSMKQEIELVSTQSACAVRLAQRRDSDRIADLAGQLGYPSTGEEVRKRLSQMQDPNQYAVFVAELTAGQIAGWIGVYVFRAVELETAAEINGLIVEEDIRSCGVGKTLLDAAEGWARSVGCDAISVRSNVTRDHAHRFYIANGYEHVKTQKEFRKKL